MSMFVAPEQSTSTKTTESAEDNASLSTCIQQVHKDICVRQALREKYMALSRQKQWWYERIVANHGLEENRARFFASAESSDQHAARAPCQSIEWSHARTRRINMRTNAPWIDICIAPEPLGKRQWAIWSTNAPERHQLSDHVRDLYDVALVAYAEELHSFAYFASEFPERNNFKDLGLHPVQLKGENFSRFLLEPPEDDLPIMAIRVLQTTAWEEVVYNLYSVKVEDPKTPDICVECIFCVVDLRWNINVESIKHNPITGLLDVDDLAEMLVDMEKYAVHWHSLPGCPQHLAEAYDPQSPIVLRCPPGSYYWPMFKLFASVRRYYRFLPLAGAGGIPKPALTIFGEWSTPVLNRNVLLSEFDNLGDVRGYGPGCFPLTLELTTVLFCLCLWACDNALAEGKITFSKPLQETPPARYRLHFRDDELEPFVAKKPPSGTNNLDSRIEASMASYLVRTRSGDTAGHHLPPSKRQQVTTSPQLTGRSPSGQTTDNQSIDEQSSDDQSSDDQSTPQDT